MKDAALADRLISYSDALVALAFVSVSGFGIAAADPDIRCSLASVGIPVSISNLLSALIMTVIIVVFRRWETSLRESDAPSEKARRYASRLHLARILIVWVSCWLMILMLWAIGRDGRCLAA